MNAKAKMPPQLVLFAFITKEASTTADYSFETPGRIGRKTTTVSCQRPTVGGPRSALFGQPRMPHKFEKLEIYGRALDYLDRIYEVALDLPASEQYNLRSQTIRAGTSIVLNIAEGSTGQSNKEQPRFLGIALRSLVETVACQEIIRCRRYVDQQQLDKMYEFSEELFAKIQAMRRKLNGP